MILQDTKWTNFRAFQSPSQEQRVSEWKGLDNEINETKASTRYHLVIEKKRRRFEFVAATLYATVMPFLIIPTAFTYVYTYQSMSSSGHDRDQTYPSS